MKKLEVVTGFAFYKQTELLEKAQFIFASMNENANFPNPEPGMKTLARSINNFSVALYDEQEYTAVKTITRSILTDDLNRLASYVNKVAAGNEAALSSSGFTLNTIQQRATA